MEKSNELQPNGFNENGVAQKSGRLSGIFKIFYEPSAVFPALTNKTAWLIPFLIVCIVGGVLGFYSRPIIAKAQMKQIYKNMENYRDRIPADRYNEIMDNLDKQNAEIDKFQWYYIPVTLVVVFLFFLIISFIGWLTGNFIFAGRANFWLIMNVVAFSALIGLLGDAVRNTLIISKGSADVFTGFGLLKPMVGDDTFLFYFLRQIDLFSIWRIVVTSIGLGYLYNIKSMKFGYVLFSIWIIFIIIVATANLFLGGSIIY